MRHHEQQKSFQNVFRIPKSSIIVKGSSSDQVPVKLQKDAPFRPRKTHTKSRLGCNNCKRRHVRCDETSGGCLKCKGHGIECDYAVHSNGQEISDAGIPTPFTTSCTPEHASSSNDSEISTHSSLASQALVTKGWPGFQVLSVESQTICDTPSVESILHHFHTATASTCGSPASQAVHASAVVTSAVHTPYLMHALLGLAVAHLRQLTPRHLVARRTRLKVAECRYWAEAFNGFRTELAGSNQKCANTTMTKTNVSRYNMDQLLSTLMLVSMHQFSYRDYHHAESDPADRSFVWIEDQKQRDAALKWLGIEAGFKGLIGAMAPWLSESFWLPIMRRVDVSEEADLAAWLSGERIPLKPFDDVERDLISICDIMTTSKDCNPYFANLETLIWCRSFRPIGPEHFNQMIAFVGRTSAEFRHLIVQRDTAALLVLLHWLQLMRDIGQWWIVERCNAEMRAIIGYLSKREIVGGMRGHRVFSLLEPPAAAVGITLPRMDEV